MDGSLWPVGLPELVIDRIASTNLWGRVWGMVWGRLRGRVLGRAEQRRENWVNGSRPDELGRCGGVEMWSWAAPEPYDVSELRGGGEITGVRCIR